MLLLLDVKIHHVMNEVKHIEHELRMLRDQLLPVLRQIADRVSHYLIQCNALV